MSNVNSKVELWPNVYQILPLCTARSQLNPPQIIRTYSYTVYYCNPFHLLPNLLRSLFINILYVFLPNLRYVLSHHGSLG
jgi:hypothetical protein